jgi:hypothetical protein
VGVGLFHKTSSILTPEDLANKYNVKLVVNESGHGEYSGGTIYVGRDGTLIQYVAADWTPGGTKDFKSTQRYRADTASAAHEIANDLFSRHPSEAHKAMDTLKALGVPTNVVFENTVDLGGLFLLEPEALTHLEIKETIKGWLGSHRKHL